MRAFLAFCFVWLGLGLQYNTTILDALAKLPTGTSYSTSIFYQFLTNGTMYSKLSTLLNQTDQNITMFVASDPAIQYAIGQGTGVGEEVLIYGALPSTILLSTMNSTSAFPRTALIGVPWVNLGGLSQVLRVVRNAQGFGVLLRIPGVSEYFSKAELTDVECTNGVFHVVRSVLYAPTDSTNQTLLEAGVSTFVSLLESVGLLQLVNNEPSITVLAPLNDAIASFKHLDLLSKEDLTRLLYGHILNDTMYSIDFKDNSTVETVVGVKYPVQVNSDGIFIGPGKLDSRFFDDITPNGVIQVISELLLPGPNAGNSIFGNMLLVDDLTTIADLMTYPGFEAILSLLKNPAVSLTVFAPVNSAASGLDNTSLASVLTVYFHILPNELDIADIAGAGMQFTPTLLNDSFVVKLGGRSQPLRIEATGGGDQPLQAFILGSNHTRATILSAIRCSNGIMYRVDSVLQYPASPSVVVEQESLHTLKTALVSTGLVPTLDNLDSVTVFGPSDGAFSELATLSLFSPALLQETLKLHVVAGIWMSADLTDGLVLKTLNGTQLFVNVTSGTIRVGGAEIDLPDLPTSSGYLHVMKSVILPTADLHRPVLENLILTPTVSNFTLLVDDPRYSVIFRAINSTYGKTVFAPTNLAMTEAGIDPNSVEDNINILSYHLLPEMLILGPRTEFTIIASTILDNDTIVNMGGHPAVVRLHKQGSNWTVNDAEIVITDVISADGSVHVIDAMLTPPKSLLSVALANALTSLLQELERANLSGVVDTTTNVTLFAPSNAAFASAGASSFSMEDIRRVLEQHIFLGVMYSTNLVNGLTMQSLAGNTAEVVTDVNGLITINGVPVESPDLLTANGVVHGVSAMVPDKPPGSRGSLWWLYLLIILLVLLCCWLCACMYVCLRKKPYLFDMDANAYTVVEPSHKETYGATHPK